MSEKICTYEFSEFCTNGKCPMCGDYCPVPDTEGVCKFENREEECFELTPKGCFVAALLDHIKLDEDIIDFIWHDFVGLMQKFGYVKPEE
jgi:hypothetical protein